ncbi:MAG: 16S rRNA (cytidine(1402)-2'-O)-methyltransferase [Chloroflexi bacterium]|nr:16S rRNA (cytidine(1402)-2'-O)-methyltransferase [Chloroflexota bacterium]
MSEASDTEAGTNGDPEADPRGPGRLYVVATPIGNLADITLRALETLTVVALIAAEDTRLTRRLLDRHGIATRTTSYHAQSSPGRLAELLAHLRAGDDIALVTDAGTPSVSDPGDDLVAAWAGEGGLVVPIPGASAVLAVVAGSAVAGPRWSFEGFLPRSGRERKERIARMAADERGTIVYEAPGRVAATLGDLATACGEDRPGAIGRELTKLHEEIVRGTLGELAARARNGELTLRGEFALVVGWWPDGARGAGDETGAIQRGRIAGAEATLQAALGEVDRRVADGAPRGDAARTVSSETGIPRRKLYRVMDNR